MSKIDEIKKNKDFILPANSQGKTLAELQELLKTIDPAKRDLVENDIQNIKSGNYDYYVNTKTGVKLQRVSNFIKDTDSKEKGKFLESASIIGRTLDKLARDVFSGKDIDPLAYNIIDPSDLKLLESLKTYIDKLKELKYKIESNGETIYADDILVYNDEVGVAGTVDIFTIDEKGVVRIYDMKTMRTSEPFTDYSGKEKYTSKLESNGKYDPTYYSDAVFETVDGKTRRVPGKTQDSLAIKHQKQLSTYAILTNNTHNLQVAEIFIIPTDVFYQAGDTTTSYIKLQNFFSHSILPEFKGAKMKNVAMEIPQATSNDVSESTNKVIEPTDIKFEEEQTSGYKNRTIKNASADATIAFAVDFNSAGERLTKSSVLAQNKLYLPISLDQKETLFKGKEFLDRYTRGVIINLNKINKESITLNIAGNGLYTLKGKFTQEQIDNYVYEFLKEVVNSPLLNKKIISIRTGGQTGVDEAGAKAASKLGIPILVLAPKGWTFRDIKGTDISDEVKFKSRFSNDLKFPEQLSLFNQPIISIPSDEEVEQKKKECKDIDDIPKPFNWESAEGE
jgi:hypothetical protein